MQYSMKFREQMVRRLSRIDGPSAAQLSREVGVHQSTLSRWLREAATFEDMTSRNGEDEVRAGERRTDDWTPEEKLQAVLDSEALSDDELGEFLRRKGLHEADLEQWREAMLGGLSDGRRRVQRGAGKRIRELERELRRKDKALAETAALLVLQKKARALLEGGDDDTGTSNDD